MKLQYKAALITSVIILAMVGAATILVFFPELFAALILGVIVSGMTYHIYHSILHDLVRKQEKKQRTVDLD